MVLLGLPKRVVVRLGAMLLPSMRNVCVCMDTGGGGGHMWIWIKALLGRTEPAAKPCIVYGCLSLLSTLPGNPEVVVSFPMVSDSPTLGMLTRK